MRWKKSRKNNASDSIPDAVLNIVGKNNLQNELLLSFLEEETGLKGRYFPKLESIPATDANGPAIPQLLIFDCKNVDVKNLWADIRKWNDSHSCPCFFVLCNAEPDLRFEKNAIDNGVQGIFYNNDPPPLIIKGIRAVLNGDIWYSRKTLNKLLMEKRAPSKSLAHPVVSRLTGREKQVLTFIAYGYSSQEIADELEISIHTVKTHSYNAYKKINAHNRLQATLWVTNHLSFHKKNQKTF